MRSDERTVPSGEHPVRVEEDLLAARHAVRAAAVAAGFTIVDQTKIVTAASELVRNAYIHGGGGTMTVEAARNPAGRLGIRLRVRDEGPGIADVDQAMTDGFSTGAGLGHGLGGTRRLVDEFDLDTAPGRGTTVTVVRWKT
ncbi:anti-sigma regulatory factor, serine/threonine protein kinase [Amycolatopsis mediterranei S699]|uniref:Anti-sigma regulatory factor, serine/threonine protein kinase n=2 Tax=Amycolatopsis mediterranei TaxID=33910 RepID=A0A9R0NVU4_AMYMS|nr:ATP-binding protein [Amycolatopsis mediterranei]ADJ44844.1 putative anti-sigma regulatory factor, serine/threonine protein kinase [Amycolatopsis mediterranei U32]AEK41592.1 anti-sigma regulatory factor, serine/threonine protein kinase [Amycolatopsis mediterranei S699]AFO76555.1 anti-sigma regulatory factor, serine/threonine protein kinase [Amycolatopsis mediterranei S699]AGT83684.1 anti-sigma regulatory factor, serine/threonine protein kinase [Amycolatopsis mediterranei RB]KDO07330.1 serine